MRPSHRLITSCARVGLWLFLAAGLPCTLPRAEAQAPRQTFTDGTGRKLELPSDIKRVYVTSPVAVVMLYAVAPEKMVGWNYKLGERERKYVLPSVRDLPALGGWFGENGKGNRETLLAARPDLILSIGNSDPTAIDFAERLQKQVGIPVFVASGKLEDTPTTLELLGKLLHRETRAAELADYSRKVLEEARQFTAKIPKEERLRVYYAEGLRGLQTDTEGSLHTEALDFIGGGNVATGQASSGFGRLSVSLDQVIAWAPDVILSCPEKNNEEANWAPAWLGEAAWKQVPAVAHKRVYQIPGAPFNWFDRPPSLARILGLKWLLWVLYPKHVHYNMISETRKFYRLFYWYELSEAEAREILSASNPDWKP